MRYYLTAAQVHDLRSLLGTLSMNCEVLGTSVGSDDQWLVDMQRRSLAAAQALLNEAEEVDDSI